GKSSRKSADADRLPSPANGDRAGRLRQTWHRLSAGCEPQLLADHDGTSELLCDFQQAARNIHGITGRPDVLVVRRPEQRYDDRAAMAADADAQSIPSNRRKGRKPCRHRRAKLPDRQGRSSGIIRVTLRYTEQYHRTVAHEADHEAIVRDHVALDDDLKFRKQVARPFWADRLGEAGEAG